MAAPVVEAVVVKAVAAVAQAAAEPAQKSQPKPEKKKIVSYFDVLLYVQEVFYSILNINLLNKMVQDFLYIQYWY